MTANLATESGIRGAAIDVRPTPASPGSSNAGSQRPICLSQVGIALSIYAGLRVLIFAAAFPLFGPTDEALHLLTTASYATFHLPAKQLPELGYAFSKSCLLFHSREYNTSTEELRAHPPLCELPMEARDRAYSQGFYVERLTWWWHRRNYEAQSPPAYYALAAVWYDLGVTFGMRLWEIAYWVRFLNAAIYGLFVWLSYRFVCAVYPEQPFLVIAVPALAAVFPQDVFFAMNRDILSPLMVAVALLLMAKAAGHPENSFRPLMLGSLLTSLAFLVEVSDVVLYGALAMAVWAWFRQSSAQPGRKICLFCAVALAATFLPALWMWRNYLVMGDLTGSKAKLQYFGWMLKPLAEIFHHPLFSFRGLSYFLVHLTEMFWRGEYQWHGIPMRTQAADRFYVLSSILLFMLFVVNFIMRRTSMPPQQRLIGIQAIWLVLGAVVFMAAISLPFAFPYAAYPSRDLPFFVSGRIVLGVLLPFLVIYAGGLQLVFARFEKWVNPLVLLACLLLFITASELWIRGACFHSPCNFFALVSKWRS